MTLHNMSISELDDMADEYEERRMAEKLDAESAQFLSEEEEVERMLQTTFGAPPEEGELKIALFKRDGEYGWVEFAGIFDSLESILLYSNKDNSKLVISEAGEKYEDGEGLDFFVVDVSDKVAEVVYGAKLLLLNSFI